MYKNKGTNMRYFLLILGILIVLDIAYFAFVNQGQMLTLNYKPLIDSFSLSSGLLYFLLGMYGVIGGILLAYSKIIDLKNEIKALRRKTEKASIVTEESSDKVKSLEAKIKTLETALKEALNKK